MKAKTSLVITSIAGADNKVLQSYATECAKRDIPYIVIGDSKSPKEFSLKGCDFYSLERQKELPFTFAALVPERHYSRKNIGYLQAIADGAEVIIETDDDNYANEAFWEERTREHSSHVLNDCSWVNLYRYFSDKLIWPRGFALNHLQKPVPALNANQVQKTSQPVQQGLANENPDVDALYRLILPLPLNFDEGANVSLGRNSWCPFNSQNTTWFKEAFLLLYLPSYCSFRMTDIWRSFVTQRICWENDWNILFHKATVWQERNVHNLLRDFEEEIPGYLHNEKITDMLESISLKKGEKHIAENLVTCYEALIKMQLVGDKEMELLHAWIADFKKITT